MFHTHSPRDCRDFRYLTPIPVQSVVDSVETVSSRSYTEISHINELENELDKARSVAIVYKKKLQHFHRLRAEGKIIVNDGTNDVLPDSQLIDASHTTDVPEQYVNRWMKKCNSLQEQNTMLNMKVHELMKVLKLNGNNGTESKLEKAPIQDSLVNLQEIGAASLAKESECKMLKEKADRLVDKCTGNRHDNVRLEAVNKELQNEIEEIKMQYKRQREKHQAQNVSFDAQYQKLKNEKNMEMDSQLKLQGNIRFLENEKRDRLHTIESLNVQSLEWQQAAYKLEVVCDGLQQTLSQRDASIDVLKGRLKMLERKESCKTPPKQGDTDHTGYQCNRFVNSIQNRVPDKWVKNDVICNKDGKQKQEMGELDCFPPINKVQDQYNRKIGDSERNIHDGYGAENLIETVFKAIMTKLDASQIHMEALVKVNDKLRMRMAQIVRQKEYLEVQHAQQILLIEQLHDGWNRIGNEDLANDQDKCHDLDARSWANFLNTIYHSDTFS